MVGHKGRADTGLATVGTGPRLSWLVYYFMVVVTTHARLLIANRRPGLGWEERHLTSADELRLTGRKEPQNDRNCLEPGQR